MVTVHKVLLTINPVVPDSTLQLSDVEAYSGDTEHVVYAQPPPPPSPPWLPRLEAR